MSSPLIQRTVHSLARVLGAVALLSCIACDSTGEGNVNECYVRDGLPPASGSVAIEYDGFAGKAPSSIPLHVSLEQAERLYFEGCVDDGTDLWWLDLDVELAATAERPAPFEMLDPNAGRITALLSRCFDSDCAALRRTWFGGGPTELALEGTIDEFDPVGGRIDFDATLIDVAQKTLETSPFAIRADLSWASTYDPKLRTPIDGRFLLTNYDNEDDEVSLLLELVQDGARLDGALCLEDEAEGECSGAELTGVVADPTLRFSWIDESRSVPVTYQLHGTFTDSGDDFYGTLSNDDETVWVEGKRQ